MTKYAILDRNGMVVRITETAEALANPPPHLVLLGDYIPSVGEYWNGEEFTSEAPVVATASVMSVSEVATVSDTDPEDIYATLYNTYEIARRDDYTRKLEYDLQDMEENIANLQTGKADTAHTHTEYAAASHTHDYAATDHTHTGFAAENHSHSEYASASHSHAGFATENHTHSEYASVEALADKADVDHTHTEYAETNHAHSANAINGLATVATSGSYNDLSNKPTIPEAYTHPVSHPASMITGLADVATSGSYNDLTDKPTIPTSLPANGGNADTVDGKNASDFATADHNHDTAYAAISHTHAQSEITGLATALSGKANATHSHADYALATDVETLSETVDGKANATHSHAQADITGLTTALAGKADATHTHSNYVTTTAFSTLEDTVEEKANASHTHAQSDITGLSTALSGKANASHTHTEYAANTALNELTEVVEGKANASHTHTLDNVSDTTSYVRMTPAERTKLSGIATGANKTTVDTEMSSTSTNPVQNKVVNTALSNKVDKVSGKGLSTNDYTTAEKTKLAGIAEGANNYTLPTASSTLGGVKTTSAVTNNSGYTACPIISGVPYYKDTNTTYTLGSFGVTATAAELNKLDGVTATTAELNYVDGVTSNIQTQLDGKAASSHNHDSAYLSKSGGDVGGNLNVNGVLRVNGQQAFYYSGTSQTIGTNNATGGTNIACGADATCNIGGAIQKTATVLPRSTGTYYCGNANFRWKGIYSAAAVNVSSDERLKENIAKLDVDEAVNLVNNIDVCSFNYIGDEASQIGVIAQDIIAKSPELAKSLVTEGEDGYYGVKTSDLVFPLIVAVQQLSKEVAELKRQQGKQ